MRMAMAAGFLQPLSPALAPSPPSQCRSTRREVSFLSPAFTLPSVLLTSVPSSAVAADTDNGEASPSTASPPVSRAVPVIEGIANTRSWFQFYGDGFSIRVPPSFDDVMEPEDYNAGTTYYGDKAKPKTYAARFSSPDRSEIVSVVIRPSNQLKITFLEAQDIKDLGSLREAAKIFVPGGASIYSSRTIKVKEDDTIRTYYYYEFGSGLQHVALMAAINRGKTYIAGAAAPQSRWEGDGVKLRSAAISLSVS